MNPSRLALEATLYNTSRSDVANTVYQVKITDADNERFEVPYSTSSSALSPSDRPLAEHGFKVGEGPFSFSISNPDTKEAYLSTEDQVLVYEDRFIQMDMLVGSNGRYWGLGDRAPRQLFLKPGVYTNFPHDTPTPIESGKPPGNNMYGMHPVMFTGLQDGRWMALFMNNFNAHDWVLQESGLEGLPLRVRFITIGGIIDLYVMVGSRIEEVVKSYHDLTGRTNLVPIFAMGYN